jgi:hypothetical protein
LLRATGTYNFVNHNWAVKAEESLQALGIGKGQEWKFLGVQEKGQPEVKETESLSCMAYVAGVACSGLHACTTYSYLGNPLILPTNALKIEEVVFPLEPWAK